MYQLATIIHYLLPIAALISLIYGLRKNAIYYVIAALWLSLIALILHYQHSGGVILGDYFSANNAMLYSVDLIILATSLIYIIEHLRKTYFKIKYLPLLAETAIALSCLVVLFNITINAYFITNRLEGTPIIQVALIKKADYCDYQYIFYKINKQGSTDYLCPNYYGFLPKIGHLGENPEFLIRQLSLPSKKQMLLLQKNENN